MHSSSSPHPELWCSAEFGLDQTLHLLGSLRVGFMLLSHEGHLLIMDGGWAPLFHASADTPPFAHTSDLQSNYQLADAAGNDIDLAHWPWRSSGEWPAGYLNLRQLEPAAETRITLHSLRLPRQDAPVHLLLNEIPREGFLSARRRRLAVQLAVVEQQDRVRLANSLHDDLQQDQIAARLPLNRLQEMSLSKEAEELAASSLDLLNRAIDSARFLTRQMRPPVLAEEGLVAAVEWLAQELENRFGLQVKVTCNDRDLQLYEDLAGLLFESLRELLFNTIQHADTDLAEVAICHEPPTLRLTVRDQGRGFRLHASENAADGGLNNIRQPLAALGGKVSIDSEPGVGTCVIIEIGLPLADQALEERQGDKAPLSHAELEPCNPSESPTCLPQVLVVDDHKMVRQGICNLLEDDDRIGPVIAAEDGETALQMVRQHQPQVVLTDVSMPGMNGIEVTRKLRESWPELPIIGLSLRDDEQTIRTMHEAGANDFLSKSDSSSTMIETILRVIEEATG